MKQLLYGLQTPTNKKKKLDVYNNYGSEDREGLKMHDSLQTVVVAKNQSYTKISSITDRK